MNRRTKRKKIKVGTKGGEIKGKRRQRGQGKRQESMNKGRRNKGK